MRLYYCEFKDWFGLNDCFVMETDLGFTKLDVDGLDFTSQTLQKAVSEGDRRVRILVWIEIIC